MTQASDDSSLDRRGSDISRRYRQLPVDSVPADLDRLILDHARAAVGAPAPHRWWIRWGFPLGFIGSALLAATVMLDGARQPAASAGVAGSARPVVAESEPTAAITQAAAGETKAVIEPMIAAAPASPTAAPAHPRDAATVPRPRAASALAKASTMSQLQAPAVSEPVAKQRDTTTPSEPLEMAPATMASDTPPEQAVSITATQTASAVEPEAGSAFEGLDALRSSTGAPAKLAVAEDRLEDIRYMRQSGRKRAADNAWRKFMQDFPEYPVPADDIARPRER